MIDSQQFYKAPQADLSPRKQAGNLPDDVFTYLGAAGKWARITAVMFFILVVGEILAIISLFFSMRDSGVTIIAIIGYAIGVAFTFFHASVMNRYAKAAKRIRQGDRDVANVEECFEMMTRFTKMQVIVILLLIVFSLLPVVMFAVAIR